MLPFAATVLAARQVAASQRMLATFGKVIAVPGAVNAISSSVSAWLDARAPREPALDAAVAAIKVVAEREAGRHGGQCDIRRESFTPRVDFDPDLRDRLAGSLAARGITAPVLPTGAGHDAGILAARLPTAMLFVRNPTGVSHAPAEHAEAADCEAGVLALAAVLEELAS
jgi:N-carbamoyl-L-amino-acid hydrolase